MPFSLFPAIVKTAFSYKGGQMIPSNVWYILKPAITALVLLIVADLLFYNKMALGEEFFWAGLIFAIVSFVRLKKTFFKSPAKWRGLPANWRAFVLNFWLEERL